MKKRQIWTRILILVIWVLIWEITARLIHNDILFAGPAETMRTFLQSVRAGDFWIAVCASWWRIGAGLIGGIAVGMLLAVCSYVSAAFEAFWRPFFQLLKAIPVASFAVLLLIWWGAERLSAGISFLVVLPFVYLNVLEGLRCADPKLPEMAAVFRMPLHNRIWYLYRPAVWPYLESAVKAGVGMAWKAGVAAEVIGIPRFSVGEGMYLAKISLDTAGVFGWTAVVIILSNVTEKLLLRMLGLIRVWQPRCRGIQGQSGAAKSEREQLSVKTAVRQPYCPEECLLAAEHIGKCYGNTVILDEYQMNFQKGQTYYFRTPSGSGKTTLFRILAGLEQPDRGCVRRSGKLAFLFQEDRLCEEYSAVKNVAIVTGKEQEAEEALKKLLPEEVLRQPVRELSGGMRRRVALVRTMEADADIIFLDEPFTGLDEENRKRAAEYIAATGTEKIILIASHDTTEVVG